jgi:hypothetical protein
MIQGIIARFREKGATSPEKGATSPEKAMTAQELGLPPRFEEAMKRRLGATGIFVDVGGKYYLDEARLKQVQEERIAGGRGADVMSGGRGPVGGVFALRIARMVVGLAAVVLALSNILFSRRAYLSFVVLGLVILWIALTVFQLFNLSRARRGWRAPDVADGSLRS